MFDFSFIYSLNYILSQLTNAQKFVIIKGCAYKFLYAT
jgi:hypothetical protein